MWAELITATPARERFITPTLLPATTTNMTYLNMNLVYPTSFH